MAPGLMMPAFSTAICATVSPRYRVWSSATGVITATWPSATLVASQEPPMPTSTTATSTGASANAAYAIAVTTSKYTSPRGVRGSSPGVQGGCASSTSFRYGARSS